MDSAQLVRPACESCAGFAVWTARSFAPVALGLLASAPQSLASLAREERAVRGAGGGIPALEVVVGPDPGDGVAAYGTVVRAAGAAHVVASAVFFELSPTHWAAEVGLPERNKVVAQEGVAAVVVGAPGGVGGAAGGVLGAWPALHVADHAAAQSAEAVREEG